MNRNTKKIERPPNPYVTANIFSKWTFWWVRDLFKKGFKRPLEDDEIYIHRQSLDSAYLTEKMNLLWEDELKRKNPSVLRMLLRAYGHIFIPLGLLYCILETGTRIAQPLCLGGLVAYFAQGQNEISREDAYFYAAGIAISALLPVLTFHPFIFCIFQIGTKMRLACSGLIYRKTLRISKAAINDGLSGRAINILSNDLGKFDLALCFFHDLWKGPVETILLGYLMYLQIGISAVIGVAFMLSFIPLQAWGAKKAAYYRQRTAERTDLRVKLMNEIIQGIQVIKMYAWEKSFAAVIDKVRRKEINAIRGTVYIHAALHTTIMISKFSIFLSLVSYAYLGDAITAQKIFTVSSFFNVLNDSMVWFWPLAITFCAEAYISTRRVKEFLLEDEGKCKASTENKIPKENVNGARIPETEFNGTIKAEFNSLSKDKMEPISLTGRKVNPNAKTKGVILDNASAIWGNVEAGENVAIDQINVEIKQGELAAIVGPVGSGKSSLFNVILGELELNKGEVTINGTISYAPQEPWLFEGTVKDNIVFIEEFNEERYKKVIHICALERDIELLPYGDMTIVGERGVSLSGGQKARVNLARAVYKQADIYLLDDPLSAVDAHVGKHIYKLCIRQFLSGTTRILITHQLQYLKDVEHLILMNSGRLEAQGRYQTLMELNKFHFLTQTHDESGDAAQKSSTPEVEKILIFPVNNATENNEEDRKELQAVGSVKLGVYKLYFHSLDSICIFTTVLVLFIVVRTMIAGVDYFISRWAIWEEIAANSTATFSNTETSFLFFPPTESVEIQRHTIVITYTVFLLITLALYLIRTYGFFYMCLRISLRLHDKLFRGITRASMYFFNTNPSGRILNRFSRDIHTIDGTLPEALIDCVSFFTDIIAVLAVVVVANYWLLFPALVVASMFYLLRYLYINTSRSIKRIESISRSPIFSHTNQTFQGLTTIRAMQSEKQLEAEFHDHQNSNTSAWFLFLATNRAFALWLDIVCVIYIGAVTFSFLAMNNNFASGDVGLAILQCISMVGMCQWGMRQTAELENQMTSVERVIEYTQQPPESSLETLEKYRPPESWPNHGKIEFINFYLKYSKKEDYTLKDLNFTIQPEERIGIVGRTGAGKSSIIQALFQLAINEGIIKIDGVDISSLGLHDLRTKISIIPQDPVLFSGTLRYNLDPFEEKNDSEMWKALEEVELKSYVSTLVGGLTCKMSDGGSNFSMGQRQLVCLARAILRNNKILILDEATANVDPEWLRDLFKKGLKRPLEDNEIYKHRHSLDSAHLTDRIYLLWEDEVNRKNPSVLRMLFRAHGHIFIPLSFFFFILETTARIAQPLCLGSLVAYFAQDQNDITKDDAYFYAAGIVLSGLLLALTFHSFFFCIFQIGTKMRLACSGLIYRKTLRISKAAINDGLSGRAINILSNDLGKFDLALCFFRELWKGPVETILLTYFMYLEIGISAVIGVLFMLSFIPLQAWGAKKAAYYRQKTAERTDLRVKLMNEIIQGIQVIKMYAWEKSFAAVIDEVRRKEINAIRGTVYIHAALHTTIMISKFSIFLSLVSYAYLGDAITAKKIFTVSSFFNVLDMSMVYSWPLAITFCAEAYVSTRRVKEFLLEDEGKCKASTENKIPKKNVNGARIPEALFNKTIKGEFNSLSKDKVEPVSLTRRKINPNAKTKAVILDNASAIWGNVEDGENVAIDQINVEIKQAELAVIVGPVGSGKSSLFNVILGELELNKGEVSINGNISYASQEPWLFEGTVKDNIIFIEEFNEERYKKVIHICALERDIELLPYGDMTIVGERGVSLSGGQKARVNLARAVYKQADIYLLDDPLSAVDAHVGKHIYKLCIRQFLSGKTRILITHQLQYLNDVEHLILMNSGRLEGEGRYQTLMELNKFQFLTQSHDESGDAAQNLSRSTNNAEKENILKFSANSATENNEEERKELQAVGSIKFRVYKSYFQSLGSVCLFSSILISFIVVISMLAGLDYYISRWAIWEEIVANYHNNDDTNSTIHLSNTTSMGNFFLFSPPTGSVAAQRQNIIIAYTSLLLLTLVLYLVRTYGFFYMCLRISRRLHDRLFRSISRATMYFFNTNPSGRILNRFSKDIRTIDETLPEVLIDCLAFFADITGILVIVAVANYWLLIPALLLAGMFYLLRYLYINTSRSIKRIESISRSPIYSHTNQTFQGLTTIRAMQSEKQLEEEFHDHQNSNTSAWFLFLGTSRAFALWLDVVCVIYIAVVTFSFLALNEEFTSGDVGLAITQCVSMIGLCQWGMRQTAELENQMTSVERVVEYTKQTPESSLETLEKYRPPESWPNHGKIEFINFYLKYSKKEDYTLKDLNFTIQPEEKIGIVGRTGAGKSSIIQALFQLAINEGIIKIDGVDISSLGLHDLRTKISIIPQDPVLFSGTLRYNLDPFKEKNDSEMWKALEEVELKSYVSTLVGGLTCKMSDGGSNFSMGQRQLVCLARAILRNNKILILDEATANVDPETDKLIQKTIKNKFRNCTVLTIAHRLHTIMDSDKVIVMDAGCAVEFGHPFELLERRNGYLRKLVDQTGAVAALTESAEQSFKAKLKST